MFWFLPRRSPAAGVAPEVRDDARPCSPPSARGFEGRRWSSKASRPTRSGFGTPLRARFKLGRSRARACRRSSCREARPLRASVSEPGPTSAARKGLDHPGGELVAEGHGRNDVSTTSVGVERREPAQGLAFDTVALRRRGALPAAHDGLPDRAPVGDRSCSGTRRGPTASRRAPTSACPPDGPKTRRRCFKWVVRARAFGEKHARRDDRPSKTGRNEGVANDREGRFEVGQRRALSRPAVGLQKHVPQDLRRHHDDRRVAPPPLSPVLRPTRSEPNWPQKSRTSGCSCWASVQTRIATQRVVIASPRRQSRSLSARSRSRSGPRAGSERGLLERVQLERKHAANAVAASRPARDARAQPREGPRRPRPAEIAATCGSQAPRSLAGASATVPPRRPQPDAADADPAACAPLRTAKPPDTRSSTPRAT